ncbi:hypothetical protein BJD99_04405 [Rhodococcus sp. 1163]|nr:hypothetical protein BJD99_04405 [Rhodococcus sp. 1163]
MSAFDGMSHRTIITDTVGVAPTVPDPVKVAGIHQITHYALGCALGDADVLGHIAYSDVRVAGDTEQRVGVVGEKRPFRHIPSLPGSAAHRNSVTGNAPQLPILVDQSS